MLCFLDLPPFSKWPPSSISHVDLNFPIRGRSQMTSAQFSNKGPFTNDVRRGRWVSEKLTKVDTGGGGGSPTKLISAMMV